MPSKCPGFCGVSSMCPLLLMHVQGQAPTTDNSDNHIYKYIFIDNKKNLNASFLARKGLLSLDVSVCPPSRTPAAQSPPIHTHC